MDRAAAPSKAAAAQGTAQRGGSEFDPARSLFCGNLHFKTTVRRAGALGSCPWGCWADGMGKERNVGMLEQGQG